MKRLATKLYKFYASKVGLIYMSLCTSYKNKRTIEKHANMQHPTGIESNWQMSKNAFRTGDTNPCSCHDYPDTHKHYLLEC